MRPQCILPVIDMFAAGPLVVVIVEIPIGTIRLTAPKGAISGILLLALVDLVIVVENLHLHIVDTVAVVITHIGIIGNDLEDNRPGDRTIVAASARLHNFGVKRLDVVLSVNLEVALPVRPVTPTGGGVSVDVDAISSRIKRLVGAGPLGVLFDLEAITIRLPTAKGAVTRIHLMIGEEFVAP